MNYVIIENKDLADFGAWSGGRDTLNTLIERGDCDAVESMIEGVFSDHTPEDVEINDFLWFERDYIAEGLGYADWDAYERNEQDEDGEDA